MKTPVDRRSFPKIAAASMGMGTPYQVAPPNVSSQADETLRQLKDSK